MNTRKARGLVYELMALFFSSADVLHSKQSHAVKPDTPMITLTTISTKRPQNPPTVIIDGIPVSFYPTTLILQADLYTKGAPVEIMPGYTVPMENTALNDLTMFCNFAGSEYAANWSQEHDVALAVSGQVMDTTSLINGTGYEFRATVELTLGFTEQAVGYSGILWRRYRANRGIYRARVHTVCQRRRDRGAGERIHRLLHGSRNHS